MAALGASRPATASPCNGCTSCATGRLHHENEQLRLDLAQQAMNGQTVIEQQQAIRNLEGQLALAQALQAMSKAEAPTYGPVVYGTMTARNPNDVTQVLWVETAALAYLEAPAPLVDSAIARLHEVEGPSEKTIALRATTIDNAATPGPGFEVES